MAGIQEAVSARIQLFSVLLSLWGMAQFIFPEHTYIEHKAGEKMFVDYC